MQNSSPPLGENMSWKANLKEKKGTKGTHKKDIKIELRLGWGFFPSIL